MPHSYLASVKRFLDQLDLNYINKHMCSVYYPLPRWSPDLVAVCQLLYKRFLWLLVKFPDELLTPTCDIDEFWHNHILHTKRYIADCNALLGHYIHHQPSDPGDIKESIIVKKQFQRTQELYAQEYGEVLQVLERISIS